MTGLAICGLGNIGAVHLENLLSLPGCSVSGVFDSSPGAMERACAGKKVRAFSSAEELFHDDATDAIVIATPTETHLSLTLKALEAGKHVFLEKPIAGTLVEGRAIVEASRNTGACLQVGFCERFNPQHLEAKRHVDAGRLGSVRAIYTSRVAPYSFGNPHWELGIFDTAVHNIDLILWLTRRMPEAVSVSGVQLYPDSPMTTHSAAITLEFGDGSLATDHITWLRDNAHPLHLCARSRMVIMGDRGTFEVDLSRRPSSLLTCDSFTMPDTVILGGTEYYGCLKLQFEYFLRSITEGIPVMATAEEALAAERVVLAAIESLRTKTKVLLTKALFT